MTQHLDHHSTTSTQHPQENVVGGAHQSSSGQRGNTRKGVPRPLRGGAVRPSLLFLLVLTLLTGLAIAPAQAAPPTPRAALEATYQAMGRPIDSSGATTYGGIIDGDCTYGLQLAQTSILTSPEANDRLRSPQVKVRAAYLAVLGREPEPGPSAHVQSMLNGRDFTHVLTSIMASPEAHARLAGICAGHPSSNARYTMGAETDVIVKGLLQHGAAEATTCVGEKAILSLAKKVKAGVVPIGKLAAEAGELTSNYLGGPGECQSAKRQLAAAAYGAALGVGGEAVYFNSATRIGPNNWAKLGGCDVYQRYDAGATAMDFRTVEGTHFMTICPPR